MATSYTRGRFGAWPLDAEGRPRPRVIRKVVKKDRKGRAKIARDRKEMIQLERIRAMVERPCGYWNCQRGGTILPGVEFAAITRPTETRRIGSNNFPLVRPYHFSCVPPEARPLVRFFKP